MSTRRERARAALATRGYKVMVCGAGLADPRSEKRQTLMEVVEAVDFVTEVVIPERDPALQLVGAAADESELAEECDALIILIEPDQDQRGAEGEVQTFASGTEFKAKTLIMVPPRLHDLVNEVKGYLGSTLAAHPVDHVKLYSDADYSACALRVRTESFVRTRLTILAERTWQGQA